MELNSSERFMMGMMKAKKADANMWWIIIGAVVALVVMIVLMVMFTGRTQPLEAGMSSCEGKGGICISGDNAVCPGRTLQSTAAFTCKTSGDVCCIGSPKKCPDECSGATCAIDRSGKSWCP